MNPHPDDDGGRPGGDPGHERHGGPAPGARPGGEAPHAKAEAPHAAEPARDAHLLAALRHAPDRDGGPPAALRESLLEAARRAAEARVASAATSRAAASPATGRGAAPRPPAASPGGGLIEGLRGLLSRPGPRTALATFAFAGVIGLIWREGPPPQEPDAPPPRPLERAEAEIARQTDGSRGPASGHAGPDEIAASRATERRAATAAPGDPAAEAATEPRPSAPAPVARAPQPQAAGTGAPARERGEPAQPPPPHTTPPHARAVAPAGPRQRDTMPAPSTPAPRADGLGEAQDLAVAGRSAEASADAPPDEGAPEAAGRGAKTSRLAAAQPDPLAAALSRWSSAWPANASAGPAGAPGWAAWLAEARRLADGRWSPVPPPEPWPTPGFELPAPQGGPLGRVALAPDRLIWQPSGADGPAWEAPLPPAALAHLRARLPRQALR